MNTDNLSLNNPHHLDKALVRRAFERAAATYDDVAVLQREVGMRLLDRLDLMRIAPHTILDIGAGTGVCCLALTRRYKAAHVVAVDLALNMLTRARMRQFSQRTWTQKLTPGSSHLHYVCADAEQLPFATASADVIFSNLAIQWCGELELAFNEFHRVLKPNGLLLFSTFGPDTLCELRASWALVDERNHINAFIDMHDIGDALQRARLAGPVMDVENFTLTYPDVLKVMHDLKMLGAHNVTAGRADGLTGKGRLSALAVAYERYRREGMLPATFEVVYGHAWAPERATANTEPGVTRVPLSQLRRAPPSR